MWEKGLVQDQVPPQAAGSQSSLSAFQDATESIRKKKLLKMSEGWQKQVQCSLLYLQRFKQTIDICKGLNRWRDL